MSKTKEIEVWRDIPEYERLYQVSNMGRVKSFERNGTKGGILKPSKNRDGYLYVVLSKNNKQKTFTIHKLVCSTFLENPENLSCVNHKNEIKTDNRVENLEFCTIRYNNNYGTRNERASKAMKGKYIGENNPMYGKISPRRKPILQFSLSGEFIKEWDSATTASNELGINKGNITSCCKRKLKSVGGYIWRYKE